MLIRPIGNYYNSEKFDNIIYQVANDLVESTMGADAKTDKGREFSAQAAENLKASFLSLPFTFYQALEAFVDGRDIGNYLKVADGSVNERIDELRNGSFIDIVLACSDRKLEVKNERAATNYYKRLFPEAQIEMADRAHDVHSQEQGRGDKTTSQERIGVSRRESFENFGLSRAIAAFERANIKLDAWLKLEQKGTMTKTELKRFQKTKAELERRSQKLDAAKEKAILSAQKRLENGKITQEHFDMRIAQIESGALSSLAVRRFEETAKDNGILREQSAETFETKNATVTEAETEKKYHIDFKERHIEIDNYAPQSPVVHTKEEKEKTLDDVKGNSDLDR